MTNVLYVCRDNEFRSLYAKAYTKKVAPWLDVDSAGLTENLSGPSLLTLQSVELGLDPEVCLNTGGHVRKSLDEKLVCWADYIFTFMGEYATQIKNNFGKAKSKTHLLSEFIGGIKPAELYLESGGGTWQAKRLLYFMELQIDIAVAKLKNQN